jgi:hypothetical protein
MAPAPKNADVPEVSGQSTPTTSAPLSSHSALANAPSVLRSVRHRKSLQTSVSPMVQETDSCEETTVTAQAATKNEKLTNQCASG